MGNLIKKKSVLVHMLAYLLIIAMMCPSIQVKADSNMAVSLEVDNETLTCSYRITGLESVIGETLEVSVYAENENDPAYLRTFLLTSDNCPGGVYTGSFGEKDFDEFVLGNYVAYFSILKKDMATKGTFAFEDDSVTQSASPVPTQSVNPSKSPVPTQSVNPSKSPVPTQSQEPGVASTEQVLSVDANTGSMNRKVSFHPEYDEKIDTSIKKAALMVWRKGVGEKAVQIGDKVSLEESKQGWNVEIPKYFKGYGTFYAQVVLFDEQDEASTYTIEPIHFIVQPAAESFTAKITKQLDKQQSFAVNINGVSSIYDVKEVQFNFYDSSKKKVHTVTAKPADSTGTCYGKIVTLKELNYKLDKYTVKAVLYDNNNEFKQFARTTTIDLTEKHGTCKVTNNSNKSFRFALKDSYIPGTIKKVEYAVYAKADGEKKARKYSAKYTESSNTYSLTVNASSLPNGNSGTYVVKAYAYSQWGTCILMKTASFHFKGVDSQIIGGTVDSRAGSFVFTIRNVKSGGSTMKAKVWCSGENKDAYTYQVKKSGSNYKVTVYAKNHNYHFGTYHIMVYTQKSNGAKTKIATGKFNFKPVNYVYTKPSRAAFAKILYIYNPSESGKITFQVYSKTKGTDDAVTYQTTRKGNYVYTRIKFNALKDAGTINVRVRADGKIFRNYTFTLKESELPKDGWYYEKYNGKTYKRYYVDGILQTDLTDVLGIAESSNSNYNNFRVEVNRAACCVTVYAYDSKTKSYCIPIKTCTVSVGRDTWTTKGVSGLNEKSSYTPLGDFSISSNGMSVKYTMKPMYEPDGSIVYARWASHVVGNVYFHSVAVSSDSHYALSPSHYNRLGTAASAGCIRMTVADAKWFYDYVSKGTPVKIVQGNAKYPGPLGKNRTIKISSSIHYDPTDPAVPNATKQKDYKAGRITGYMTSSGKRVGY